MKAEHAINYYDGFKDVNPSNPMNLEISMNVTERDPEEYEMMRVNMNSQGYQGLDIIAYEGCLGDDMTFLGGKEPFLNHFCNFFDFEICYAPQEKNMEKNLAKLFSDSENLNDSINNMMKQFDDIK